MTTPTPPIDCEVLVIGGGPAGSTMATLLARQGRRVVMLEKSRHPRFHVGESLLPANVKLFDDLGVREAVERIGMPKWGAEFVSPDHPHPGAIEFAEAWDKSMPLAWQVRRSELDDILFRHAQAAGAEGLEGCRVRRVDFDADGASVVAELDGGDVRQWRARYVVDASGRDTLLSKQFDAKRKNPKHSSSALYGHFTGARRHEGKQEGNISIFWFQHGWFWFIPLKDGTTSVGTVCWPYYLHGRKTPLPEFFAETIAQCPPLARRLEGATLLDNRVWATGNYTYTSTHCCGDRYLMLGDAYAFLDPVFSSGVYLAMNSAYAGLPVVQATLDHGPAGAAAARRAFEAEMLKGPREFSWFIYRVTNPVMRDLFLNPRNPFRVKEALISLLAGDIFGRTPIWGSLRVLKAIYYLGSLANVPRTWRAWLRRRSNIRNLGDLPGENVLEAP